MDSERPSDTAQNPAEAGENMDVVVKSRVGVIPVQKSQESVRAAVARPTLIGVSADDKLFRGSNDQIAYAKHLILPQLGDPKSEAQKELPRLGEALGWHAPPQASQQIAAAATVYHPQAWHSIGMPVDHLYVPHASCSEHVPSRQDEINQLAQRKFQLKEQEQRLTDSRKVMEELEEIERRLAELKR